MEVVLKEDPDVKKRMGEEKHGFFFVSYFMWALFDSFLSSFRFLSFITLGTLCGYPFLF